MLNRFDILLRWLLKPNTTLPLYPGLGQTINIGGVFQTSRTFFPCNSPENSFSEYTTPEEGNMIVSSFHKFHGR